MGYGSEDDRAIIGMRCFKVDTVSLAGRRLYEGRLICDGIGESDY